jgi:hypothetical protein
VSVQPGHHSSVAPHGRDIRRFQRDPVVGP